MFFCIYAFFPIKSSVWCLSKRKRLALRTGLMESSCVVWFFPHLLSHPLSKEEKHLFGHGLRTHLGKHPHAFFFFFFSRLCYPLISQSSFSLTGTEMFLFLPASFFTLQGQYSRLSMSRSFTRRSFFSSSGEESLVLLLSCGHAHSLP